MNDQSGTIAERVARGVALLDDRVPGWALALPRLSRLAIGSGHNCILGQLFGYVWDGRRRIGITVMDMEQYGFAEWRRPYQREITETWRGIVRSRRAAQTTTAGHRDAERQEVTQNTGGAE